MLWLCCQPSDPFGTGLFIPAGGTSALTLPSRNTTSSEPPQLPPKQHKRAPAPPRPPAPKPAGGSVPGRLDAFEGNDPFARSHRTGSGSTSSKKNDAFAKFAEASPGRVSIDAEKLYADSWLYWPSAIYLVFIAFHLWCVMSQRHLHSTCRHHLVVPEHVGLSGFYCCWPKWLEITKWQTAQPCT